MNVVTGRGAARDHEDRPTGPAVGGDPGPEPAAPRVAGVAPQPRLVPSADPVRSGPPRREDPPPRPAPAGGAVAHPDPSDPGGTRAQPGPARLVGPAGRRGAGRRGARRGGADHRRAGGRGAASGAGPAAGSPAARRRPDGDPAGRRRRLLGADRAGALGRHPGPQGPGTGAVSRLPAGPAPGTQPHAPTPGSAARARRAGGAEPGRGLLRLGQRRPVLARGRACPDGHRGDDDCSGGGLTLRCRGIFTAEDGRFIVHGVRVSGVPVEGARPVPRCRRG